MSVSVQEPALLGAPSHVEGSTADRALMTRCLAYLFGAGATLAVVTLPTSTSSSPVGILISETGYALAAVVLLAILLVNFSRLPLWTFQFTLASGTGLISFVIYASGDPTSPYTMFYLWIALYAFYFFRVIPAAAQLIVVALAYGAVLYFKEAVAAPGTRWLITMATLAVAATLIALLRNRVDGLVARLTETARTDSLTGLLNRRGFDDSFGHDMGDDALERVGALVRGTKRRIDTAARFGGEEFALLLPYNDAQGSHVVSERVREQVREAFSEDVYHLTVSLGIANFPTDGNTCEDLLRAADRALYVAKRSGRDRSVIYSDSLEATALEPAGSSPARDALEVPGSPLTS